MREVCLPEGALSFHVCGGDSFPGGETVTVPAPLGEPPVFSRDVELDCRYQANGGAGFTRFFGGRQRGSPVRS